MMRNDKINGEIRHKLVEKKIGFKRARISVGVRQVKIGRKIYLSVSASY